MRKRGSGAPLSFQRNFERINDKPNYFNPSKIRFLLKKLSGLARIWGINIYNYGKIGAWMRKWEWVWSEIFELVIIFLQSVDGLNEW